MKLISVPLLLTFICAASSQYNYERSDDACMAMFKNCRDDPDNVCRKMLETYMDSCSKLLEEQTKTCNRRCKISFVKLLQHPTMSRFGECDCFGNVVCKKQKCTLIESCLNEECRDEVPTTPSPAIPSSVSVSTIHTPSEDRSLTMSSSTRAEVMIDCETVIVQCERTAECLNLMRLRDEACHSYPMLAKECTMECVAASMALRNNSVGTNMGTCVYATVNDATKRLTNLMRYCVENIQSPAPTVPIFPTPSPDRPWGDCKRHSEECHADEHCRHSYNVLMKACKVTSPEGLVQSTCTEECSRRIEEFMAIRNGENLWSCSCNIAPVSRNCEVIRHTFNDICTNEPCSDYVDRFHCRACLADNGCSEHCGLLCKKTCGICANPSTSEPTTATIQPLSTKDESLPTPETTTPHSLSNPFPTSPHQRSFYNVSVHCEDRINVRISYSSDMDYVPTFTAQDHSCKADGTPPVLSLNLEYNPKKCGTRREKTKDAKYAFKNRIYVRSADLSYSEIADVECPTHYKSSSGDGVYPKGNQEAIIGDGEVSMTFFSDNDYSRTFEHRVDDGEQDIVGDEVAAVLDLKDNKTVYVQLESKMSHGSFVVESCYATPNRQSNYSAPYYLLENGCRRDDSLNFDEFKPGGRARFSFSRMKFTDKSFPGEVYIHCSVILCNKSDPECQIKCRTGNKTRHYARLDISEGPYTFNSCGNSLSPLCSLVIFLLIFLLTVR